MLQYFLGIVTLLFTFLSVIWSSRSLLDLAIKIMFIGMTVWSGVLLAMNLGFIVKL